MPEEQNVNMLELIISRDEKHEWLSASIKVKVEELEDLLDEVFGELLGGIPGMPSKKLKKIKIHPGELIAAAAQLPLPVFEKFVNDLNMLLRDRQPPP